MAKARRKEEGFLTATPLRLIETPEDAPANGPPPAPQLTYGLADQLGYTTPERDQR